MFILKYNLTGFVCLLAESFITFYLSLGSILLCFKALLYMVLYM